MKKSEVKIRLIGNGKYKYEIEFTNVFKKDVVNAKKRGLNLDLLGTALKILATKGVLPSEYKPPPLHNNSKTIWNFIYSPTGYLSGNRMMMF
jgi:hypothetical protein